MEKSKKMKYKLLLYLVLLTLSLIKTNFGQDTASFDMQEVSAFTTSIDATGQYAECNNTNPDKDVKRYPEFESEKPLYGSVTFDSNYTIPDSGTKFYFAIDESKGTNKGYDTFYFDSNHNLDLTDDKPLNPIEKLPKGLLQSSGNEKIIYFDYLTINFDYGPEIGIQPFKIIPCLTFHSSGYVYLNFIPTVARKGNICIGNYKYEAILIHDYKISGRFDRPDIKISLTPREGAPPLGRWQGADMMRGIHSIDGKLYSFSTTPKGDKLFVNTYKGDLGIFTIGSGKRKIKDMSVMGCLMSENTAVAVGKENPGEWPSHTTQCEIPVGEYFPNTIYIGYGDFSMKIEHNEHSDGRPYDRQGRPMVYFIKIAKDKPFVFDFPNQPEILFTSPKKDAKFKSGDSIRIETYLIDQKLDFAILRLEKNSRKLPPLVEIFNSSGKRIVTGAMEYG